MSIKNELFEKKLPLAAKVWQGLYGSNFYRIPFDEQSKYAEALWAILKEEKLVD